MKRALAVVTYLALIGCAGGQNAAEDDEGSLGFIAGDGVVTILPETERAQAPTLEGPSVQDFEDQISSADFAGKFLIINVWGSWCAPCRHEAPELVEADQRLGDDVQFLGLNTRDLSQGPAQAFVRSFGIEYPNIFDPDGTLLLGFGELPPKAIPSTIIVDTESRVAARVIGEVDANTLVQLVGDLR